jgi:hypothetical protein
MLRRFWDGSMASLIALMRRRPRSLNIVGNPRFPSTEVENEDDRHVNDCCDTRGD